MKKTNQMKQKRLQAKRTKRNQARKAVKYNPNRYLTAKPEEVLEL